MKRLIIILLLILSGCNNASSFEDVSSSIYCTSEECSDEVLSADAKQLIEYQANDTCFNYANYDLNQQLLVYKNDDIAYNISSENSIETEGLTKIYLEESGKNTNIVYDLNTNLDQVYKIYIGDKMLDCTNSAVNLQLKGTDE